jgi:hypothetical protein
MNFSLSVRYRFTPDCQLNEQFPPLSSTALLSDVHPSLYVDTLTQSSCITWEPAAVDAHIRFQHSWWQMQDVHGGSNGGDGAGEAPVVHGVHSEATPLSMLLATDALTDWAYETGQTDIVLV